MRRRGCDFTGVKVEKYLIFSILGLFLPQFLKIFFFFWFYGFFFTQLLKNKRFLPFTP